MFNDCSKTVYNMPDFPAVRGMKVVYREDNRLNDLTINGDHGYDEFDCFHIAWL